MNLHHTQAQLNLNRFERLTDNPTFVEYPSKLNRKGKLSQILYCEGFYPGQRQFKFQFGGKLLEFNEKAKEFSEVTIAPDKQVRKCVLWVFRHTSEKYGGAHTLLRAIELYDTSGKPIA